MGFVGVVAYYHAGVIGHCQYRTLEYGLFRRIAPGCRSVILESLHLACVEVVDIRL